MARWTETRVVSGEPDDVLALLIEPEAITRWAPVGFEVIDFDGSRLFPGDRVRARGLLAGRTADFEVEVHDAHDGRLALTAAGPIRVDVEYVAMALDDGTELQASIAVSGEGMIGRVLARAADALLAGGALSRAMTGIARELERAVTYC